MSAACKPGVSFELAKLIGATTAACAVLLLVLSAVQTMTLIDSDARTGQWIGVGLQALIGIVLLIVAFRQIARRNSTRSDG